MITALVFLPLIAAILVGLNTHRISEMGAQIVTVSGVAISAVLAWVIFFDVVVHKEVLHVLLFPWIESGDFSVTWGFYVDPLTSVMLLLVTTVSALVHLYSVGYMHHDEHPQRFMAYLSLFTFFMLMLVTADNFIQLFLGWEGVGLSSYLLIGFWFKKESANNAAIKAFIVNRVGDLGFALGIAGIFLMFGSVEFKEVFSRAAELKDSTMLFLGHEYHAMTVLCILLFIGAMGKSAQFGLHTWLPDAMEGPTPVSALIHAATMVTAGVFLVARCSPLFEYAPLAREIVTYVGAITCIFAATVAFTQHDIKRVIAYSTCSQLGYMFFACGVSAYSAGVFHLLTHGFFKALLFLGAGSVIHAMSNEQDMRNMGGLWKKIPFTYAMMMVGTLAIIGLPPLAGYYSKDSILASAFASGAAGNQSAEFAFWMGIAAATLTSFYSWRLIFLTFHGKSRASKEVQDHVHESPAVMTLPLFVLAVGAVISGFVLADHMGVVHPDMAFWHGSITMLGEANILEEAEHIPHWVMSLVEAVVFSGFVAALLAYLLVPTLPDVLIRIFRPLHRFLYNKWFVDELYDVLWVRPARGIGNFLWQRGDIGVIDRFGPDGLSSLSHKLGAWFNRLQSGYVYHYALVTLLGVVAVMGFVMYSFRAVMGY